MMLKLLAVVMAIISATLSINQIALASNNQEQPDDVILIEVIVGDEETVKNIELEDGTKIEEHNYEIKYTTKLTRDPAYIASYFSLAAWITRNNQISLSLKPLSSVRNSYSKKEEAWTVLSGTAAGLGSHKNWPTSSQKVKTFKWQYDCHYYFANDKSEWNIEPWRSAGSYAAVIAAKCNP